jgi:tetratricopeptide (TPR) repeat protein
VAEELEAEGPEIPEPAVSADVALAAALDEARAGAALAPDVKAFFDAQTRLTNVQREHMTVQFKLEHKGKLLDNWSKRLKLLLQSMTVAVGLAIAGLVAVMVWQAARSHALIVEPFHAPPDMASNGVDGTVIASGVLDKLEGMRAEAAVAARATVGYTAEASREVNIEIPETGMSIGELRRGLQEWLGHDRHISGSLVHDGEQLALAVRTEQGAKVFKGTQGSLDGLEQQAAEEIFRQSQPLAYANYLIRADRRDDAVMLLRTLTTAGSRDDRAWALVTLGRALRGTDVAAARTAYTEAAELNPRLWLVWEDLADLESFFEHDDETAIADRRRALAATDFGGGDPDRVRDGRLFDAVALDEVEGDYAASVKPLIKEADTAADPDTIYHTRYYVAYETAYLHDVEQSRLWTQRAMDAAGAVRFSLGPARTMAYLRAWQAADVEDWAGATAAMAQGNAGLSGPGDEYWFSLQAMWLAKAGQVAQAQAIVQPMTDHCYFCLLARATVAEASGDRKAADGFFQQALGYAPSSVRGINYWARAKLARGDVAGAIALFQQANVKGPHFADALEGWGEALMRQGDPSAASAKFRAAADYAPNWGGNRLRWGEARDRLGKRDQADAQYALAAKLALSADERAALAKDRKAH